MMEEGIITPFRLASVVLVSAGALLLTLFEGGTVQYFLQPAVMAVALAALAAEAGCRKDGVRKAEKMPEASALLLALVFLAVASFAWSADKGATMAAAPEYLMYAAAFWAVSRMVPKARQASLFMILILSSAMLGFSLFGWAFSEQGTAGPPRFPFAASDGFAALALIVSAFSTGMLLEIAVRGSGHGEGAGRYVLSTLFALSAASAVVSWSSLMMSGSPFSFLSAVFVAVLLFFMQEKEDRGKAAAVIFSSLAVALAVALFLAGTGDIRESRMEGAFIFPRFGERLAEELSYRARQWTLAIRLGLKSPVFGFGAGTFKDAMPLVYSPGPRPASGDPMGLLTSSFAELGLAGLALAAGFAGTVAALASRGPLSGKRMTPALLGPLMAATVGVITGSMIPSIMLLYSILAGCVSAEASKGYEGSGRRHGRIPAVAVVILTVLAVAASSWYVAVLPVKEEVLHHLEHAGAEGGDTLEDALVDLKRAHSLDPLDKELFYEMARTEFMSESLKDAPDYEPALEKTGDLIALYPHYREAYELRGTIEKAMGLPWADDLKEAALYSAGNIGPHIALISKGLNEKDYKLAKEYAEKALAERDQLLYRAKAADLEGVVALSYLVDLEARAYVLYARLGDEAAAAAEAGRLRDLYGLNTAVEGHVRAVLERYGAKAID